MRENRKRRKKTSGNKRSVNMHSISASNRRPSHCKKTEQKKIKNPDAGSRKMAMQQ